MAQKKKSGKSPTQRCIAVLKERGWTYQVVEHWNAWAHIRQDLFGCIDILACHPTYGIVGIQACVGGSHSARRDKALVEPRLLAWLESGGKFEVWSWAERGERDEKKVWTLRVEPFLLSDQKTRDSLVAARTKRDLEIAKAAAEKEATKATAKAMKKAARAAARSLLA